MTTTTHHRALPAHGLRHHSLSWLLLLLLGGLALATVVALTAHAAAVYAAPA